MFVPLVTSEIAELTFRFFLWESNKVLYRLTLIIFASCNKNDPQDECYTLPAYIIPISKKDTEQSFSHSSNTLSRIIKLRP